MNNRKRQRDATITTDDSDDQQIVNKLRRTYSSFSALVDKDKYSITIFEDFSNELIYEIFDYLSPHDIYQGFVNLNTRFQNILFYVNIPVKINNISSKTTFENYFNEFITPMQHRMKKLHVSDPFTIEYIFSVTENILVYSQLQKLFLENIESSFLENLLNRLVVLPSLSSLTVHVGYGSDRNNIYKQIFQLPMLKYCNLSFEEIHLPVLLPNFTNTSSPIENLIITDDDSLININAMLPYLPKLRRFSMTKQYEYASVSLSMIALIRFKNLTQLSFTTDNIQSNDIEQFLKNYAHQIELLHFFTYTSHHNLSVKELEKLISIYFRRSKIVELLDLSKIDCYHIMELYQSLCNRSDYSIYDIGQWFFSHQTMSEEYLHEILCSFQPYQRQNYINPYSSDTYKHKCHFNNVIHSVRNVIIQNAHQIVHKKSFPNATQLTFNKYCNNYAKLLSIDEFHKIIPITKITKLNIDNKRIDVNEVLDILVELPNIDTLTLISLELVGRNIPAMEEHDTFRLISKQNRIKNVTITHTYTLKTIQMLMKLCPKLQHLTLGIAIRSLLATIRFFLSDNDEISCQVFSLCVLYPGDSWITKIKEIIQFKRPLNDYSLKICPKKLYLWW